MRSGGSARRRFVLPSNGFVVFAGRATSILFSEQRLFQASHSLFSSRSFLFQNEHAPRRRLQGRGARPRGLVPVVKPHGQRRVVGRGVDGTAGEERERQRERERKGFSFNLRVSSSALRCFFVFLLRRRFLSSPISARPLPSATASRHSTRQIRSIASPGRWEIAKRVAELLKSVCPLMLRWRAV